MYGEFVYQCMEWKFGYGGGNITWKAHDVRDLYF